ncbi:MAG TPA: potassium-transporting ATPase subunit KdpA, partial [Nitrososphaerales archaeon]|nr:potassium-transporting ATPase subunit KdpA [Nitrososphaerales archaeon]
MLEPAQIIEIGIVLAVAVILAWPLSKHITRIFKETPSRLDRFLLPVEKAIYNVIGVDPSQNMGWKEYFFAAFFVNVVQMGIAFVILVYQNYLPLNPQGFPGFSWDLAFNTVTSFATNTNLQHYAGEQSLSIFSQMTAIQFLQFTSATTGICVGIAMVRSLVAHSKNMGNFYVDFVRALTRLFIPLCLIAALISVWLGSPQTLNASTLVTTIQGSNQKILMGPVSSLISIMQLGTNGGGFYGANSAFPLQNPSPASDVLQILLMLLIPTALCFVLGEYIGKKRESIPIIVGAYLLFAIDLAIAFIPTPLLNGPGLETRFGGFMSTFWTVVTTAVTTGSVNSSLAGNNPLAILAAFMGMLIQSTPGGKGVGLMYMLMYVIITVFIVGLMSGRTPEYLGMKVTGRDVKLVMIAFLIHPLAILVPSVVAYASGAVAAIGY